MKKRYARIVFGAPPEGPFDYAVPDCLRKSLKVGKRVRVPFREEKRVGCCIGISRKTDSSYTKEICSVLDNQPVFGRRLLAFLKKLSGVYFSTWGEMLESALPAYLRKGRKTDAGLPEYRIGENPAIDTSFLDEDLTARTRAITEAIEKSRAANFLLCDDYLEPRRVRVFLELTRIVLRQAKDVLVIVPEIATAEAIAEVFRKNFGASGVLVYYGGLKEKEGFITWSLMREKFPKVIIGTRIAIYHPGELIGLIIVDDEGSLSHKQDEFPFYNARDVALLRARFFRIPLLLCGSPPSVETYYRAEKKDFILIDLRNKIINFPQVSVVDSGMSGRNVYISKPLEVKIIQVLNEGKKIVLFLNRRGFSTLVRCIKCGKVVKCQRCEQNLVYHFDIKRLACHRCGYSTEAVSLCPGCHCSYLRYQGLGTEKLESELNRIFPQARVARLDSDVKKEKAAEKVARDFRENRTDILIGTSLLFKEPALPPIGLAGIINLEQGINFPDFRGTERLFSLLLNLVKLLRNGDRWGHLLIQTHNPDSKIIAALTQFDYDLIYREEIKARKDLGLPPFRNLIILNLRGKNKRAVENNARELSRRLRENKGNKNIFISEAVPHPLYRLRDNFRWQVFIKSRGIEAAYKILKTALGGKRRFRGNILTVDVEPGQRFW